MDLRNFKKQMKSEQSCDKIDSSKFSSDELSNLAMSQLSSLPINPFSQLNSVNVQQLLGKC